MRPRGHEARALGDSSRRTSQLSMNLPLAARALCDGSRSTSQPSMNLPLAARALCAAEAPASEHLDGSDRMQSCTTFLGVLCETTKYSFRKDTTSTNHQLNAICILPFYEIIISYRPSFYLRLFRKHPTRILPRGLRNNRFPRTGY